MTKSKIGWCDETINFFTGCNHGCSYCYARRMAHRLGHIPGTAYERVRQHTGNPFAPAFHPVVLIDAENRLTAVHQGGTLDRRPRLRPRRVFVGSMGDMCAAGVFGVYDNDGCCLASFTSTDIQHEVAKFSERLGTAGHTTLALTKRPDLLDRDVRFPASLQLGVSVTDSSSAHMRVRSLMDIAGWWRTNGGSSALGGRRGPGLLWASVEPLLDPDFDPRKLMGVGWVVVGLDSSPGARGRTPEGRAPLVAAARRIARWCRDNSVACYIKESVSSGFPEHVRRDLPQQVVA